MPPVPPADKHSEASGGQAPSRKPVIQMSWVASAVARWVIITTSAAL